MEKNINKEEVKAEDKKENQEIEKKLDNNKSKNFKSWFYKMGLNS